MAEEIPALGDLLPSFSIGTFTPSPFQMGILLFVLIGGAIAGYYLYKRKMKLKVHSYKKIVWWEDVNGELVRVGQDEAEEIIIPTTNLRVFYVKEKDMWLPRFTNGVELDMFFVALTKGRELVNFTLSGLEKNMKKAGLNFDHTDMRWAAENTREFIKRNYRDKTTSWWKEYKEMIQIVVFIVMMTISALVIIYFLGNLVDKIGVLVDNLIEESIRVSSAGQPSGVISGELRT